MPFEDYPIIIADPDGLQTLAQSLQTASRAAVDTESNSLHAFRERVCLIQISLPDRDYLVDPLAVPDLSPLRPFLEDPGSEKVMHAAEYDLICLRRDFGFRVRGLFDTCAAARSLGIRAYGLSALLTAEFGIALDKSMQRADWGRRPLPERQVEYARRDTHYLLALCDRLASRIDAADRREELDEEFRRLEQIPDLEPEEPEIDPFWRLRGVRDLTPPQRAVLRSLFEWREQEAERIDRPSFYILSEDHMVRMAEGAPASEEELVQLGVSPRTCRRWGKGILAAIRRGKTLKPPVPIRNGRLDERGQMRLEALRKWRKRRAQMRGVESDVILCRDSLYRIARLGPDSLDALGRIPGIGPFRLTAYGEEILAALQPYRS
jgi:ribonuclease D